MENPLKISVAIPAYKTDFLQEAIASIIAQTYQNWELIIVDDCSPNNIAEIVSKYDDKRIRYYRNEKNVGANDPSKNWNVCLDYAEGEYFCLLCDDDLYEPAFLESMLQLAESDPDCNVFRSRAKVVNAEGQTIEMYPSIPLRESCEEYIWHVGRNQRYQTISEWMFRTDHIRKCGGYSNLPFAWGSDYLSIFKFSVEGGIVSQTTPLVAFRSSSVNISNMPYKNCVEKLWALRQFEVQFFSLIEKNNMPESLKKEFVRYKRRQDAHLMRYADWKTFLQVIPLRKEYDIQNLTFLIALRGQLMRRLTSLCKN